MLLSFSEDKMLPMLCIGAIQVSFLSVSQRACAIAHKTFDKCAKRQTIREVKNANSPYRRLRRDDTLHLWWKSRTAERFEIAEVICKSVAPIEIGTENGFYYVDIFSKRQTNVQDIAYDDGFSSVDEFFNYFLNDQKTVFKGVVITW